MVTNMRSVFLLILCVLILSCGIVPASADILPITNSVLVTNTNNWNHLDFMQLGPGSDIYIELPYYDSPVVLYMCGRTPRYSIGYSMYSTSTFNESTITTANDPPSIDLLESDTFQVIEGGYNSLFITEPTQFIKLKFTSGDDATWWGDEYPDLYPYIFYASGDEPEFNDVSWDHDPYYTGDTATITTNIFNFDNATYSYYLDLYSTTDYLTTFELTSETELNYYTFPLGWTDTSLLAKLVRVTDPYATNEVQLAYDISHFETLDWDTTVSFNKSSYNPSESLKVTWSGAADGSNVWLRAGDDGEVIEYDVAYSGSFTFNVPANTTETYYIVDVITGGYSQVQASCVISLVPDFFFNYSVTVEQDEYSPGDIVNVTYSTDQNGQIQVVKTISDNIYHSIGFTSGAINATGLFYITEDEPYGFYDVYLLDSSNSILDSVRYALLPSTSSLEILQSSVYLHESFVVFAQTVNESILSIEDPDGIEVWNKSIDALMYDFIYYTPTIKTGVYTVYLYDDYTLSDTILVYYADDPDVPDDDVPDDDVIEDVLDDDESMTDYFEGKFREFAPTAWGIFLLSIILWLMAILTSFGGSSKRR